METIIRSAIDIGNGVCATGKRHCGIIHALAKNGFDTPITFKQGFLTSTGAFVGRTEARIIALSSGQVKKTITDELDSSDLW